MANIAQIEKNFRILNDLVIVERAKEDYFLRNESLWSCNTADGIFYDVVFSKIQDKQLSQQVIPKLLQNITSISEEFSTIEEFNKSNFRIYNAFYGIVFDEPLLDEYIRNKETYLIFKNKYKDEYLSKITPKILWEKKELLFSKVVLCPGIEDDLKKIEVKDLTTIVVKLIALDRYVAENWTSGSFNYHKANEQISLRISPESESTMNKYGGERSFKMPDGTIQCFELHIKIGSSLRIHFYPKDREIFVGYIGKHLSIVSCE